MAWALLELDDDQAAALSRIVRDPPRPIVAGPGIVIEKTDNSIKISSLASSRRYPSATGTSSIYVKVKKDGGVAGDSTTQCTFTYMIFAESETIYDAAHTLKNADGSDAVLLTPVQRRSPVGAYLQPADGTLGEARFNAATGQWQLMTVYREVLNTLACPQNG